MSGRKNNRKGKKPKTAPARESDAKPSSVETPPPAGEEPTEVFGLLNWVLSVVGVTVLVFGYVLLSRANSQGDNFPALVAPFMILGSYGLIFVAIVLRLGGGKS